MPKRKVGSVDESLGRNLTFFRKMAGLTQQQIAEQLNLNRTTYTKYETGASEPSIEILKALADILQVDVGLLLSDHIDPDLAADVIEGYRGKDELFFTLWKRFDSMSREEQERVVKMMLGDGKK